MHIGRHSMHNNTIVQQRLKNHFFAWHFFPSSVECAIYARMKYQSRSGMLLENHFLDGHFVAHLPNGPGQPCKNKEAPNLLGTQTPPQVGSRS